MALLFDLIQSFATSYPQNREPCFLQSQGDTIYMYPMHAPGVCYNV